MIYSMYFAKVLYALQRQLSKSEVAKVAEFYNKGYSVNYTIEYLK